VSAQRRHRLPEASRGDDVPLLAVRVCIRRIAFDDLIELMTASVYCLFFSNTDASSAAVVWQVKLDSRW
jgi:hypothetical protein